jgi:multiple sugar transport system ATP-binding protein
MPRSEVAVKVQAAAELLELGTLLERKPAALSGGQRQRVALGRALVRDPQVFLLDEPLSNLDAKLSGAMRLEIARLHRRLGATMVYVTHDQIEAMTLGQRIVVMKDGHVQQIDTPMSLYDRPSNLFVATFLGSPGMNVLRGRLARGDGLALVLDGGALPLAPSVAVPDAWLGREVALGIRPEALRPATAKEHGFDATVEVVEPVGNESFVNLSLGGQALVLRCPPQAAPEVGQAWRLAAPGPELHWFDADSGARIGP